MAWDDKALQGRLVIDVGFGFEFIASRYPRIGFGYTIAFLKFS